MTPPPESNLSAAPAPAVPGPRRILYLILGFGCVGLAGVGWVLPGLPTTPFLLLASHFFLKSYPPLNDWLMRSPIFGPFLRDWHRHRGVRPHVKIVAIAMIIVVVALSIGLGGMAIWLRIVVALLAMVGIVVILRLRTIR